MNFENIMVDLGHILMSSMTSLEMLSAASPQDKLRFAFDEFGSVGEDEESPVNGIHVLLLTISAVVVPPGEDFDSVVVVLDLHVVDAADEMFEGNSTLIRWHGYVELRFQTEQQAGDRNITLVRMQKRVNDRLNLSHAHHDIRKWIDLNLSPPLVLRRLVVVDAVGCAVLVSLHHHLDLRHAVEVEDADGRLEA
jgi:hypothetical protein